MGYCIVNFRMNHLLLLHIKRIRFAQTGKSEYKTLSECPIVTAAQRSSEIPIFLNTQRFGRKSLSLHATVTFPSRVQKCYLNHIFKIIIHSLMETGIQIMEVLMLIKYRETQLLTFQILQYQKEVRSRYCPHLLSAQDHRNTTLSIHRVNCD